MVDFGVEVRRVVTGFIRPKAGDLMEDGSFVGRDDQLAALLALLPPDGKGRLVALTGVHGIGKKWLLQRLRRVAEEAQGILVLRTDAEYTFRYSGAGSAWSGLYGPRATPESARQLFERSVHFLEVLAQELGREHFAQFEQQVKFAKDVLERAEVDAHHAPPALGGGWRAETSHGSRASVDRLQATVDQLQATVDADFVARWNGTVKQRVLLLVAGFDALVDDPVGQWFARLAPRLANTLTVVPLVPPSDGSAVALPVEHETVTVPPFTKAEVATYLTSPLRFGTALDAAVPDEVFAFTGGHPFAVKLAAEALRARFRDGPLTKRDAHQLLAQLPENQTRRFEQLFKQIVGGDLRFAVEAASVVHSFDADLLAKLLDPEREDTAAAEAFIDQMDRLGLLESTGDGRRSVHDFIRAVVRPSLQGSRSRWVELHRRAAGLLQEEIKAIEGCSDPGTFGRWLKYEDPDWQALKSEWLRHTVEVSTDRAIIRAELAAVFLDAFWWWGCYIEFPFCWRMLDEFDLVARDEDDRELLDSLRRFHDNYPKGYRKPPGECWDEVESALVAVRKLCGLDNWAKLRRTPSAGEHPVRARVFGLIQLFLAHSRWYGGAPERAGGLYRQAVQEYRYLEDDWMVAWLSFEWAELCAEQGRLAEAGEHARQAVGALQVLAQPPSGEVGEIDEELVANLHRLLADILWPSDPARSGLEYGRAVLHAYLSQSWLNPLRADSSPPDPYTQQFYKEMTTRAAEGVLAAAAGPAIDAAALLTAMTEPFRPAFAGGLPGGSGLGGLDLAAVATALFPPGPTEDDLGQKKSAFIQAFDKIKEDVSLDLDWLADLAGLAEAFGALAQSAPLSAPGER
jgi:hypothetical protein